MKLFKRDEGSPKSVTEAAGPKLIVATCAAPAPLRELPVIALTAEEKTMLAQPIDPRVGRILEELRAIKAAEELAPGSSRIIRFPGNDSRDGQSPDARTQSTDGF
jgi:hypothetical protein